MGMWDEYCLVCGGPSYLDIDDMNEGKPEIPQPNAADYTWLEAFVGISHTEDVVPLSSYDFHGNFDTQSEKYTWFNIGCGFEHDVEKATHGYACHVKCYSLLQRELNYTLKHQDVQPLLTDSDFCALNKFAWSDYGGLAEYQDQGFCTTQLVEGGKLWMIEDPTTNAENAQRILKLWRPLVQNGFQRPESAAIGSPSCCGDAAPAHDIHCERIGAAIAGLDIDDSGAQQ